MIKFKHLKLSKISLFISLVIFPLACISQSFELKQTSPWNDQFNPVGNYKGSGVSVAMGKKDIVIDIYSSESFSIKSSFNVSLKETEVVKRELYFRHAILSEKSDRIWIFATKSEHSGWLFGGVFNLVTNEFEGWKPIMKRKNPSNSYNGIYYYAVTPDENGILVAWRDSWKTTMFDATFVNGQLEQKNNFSFPLKETLPDFVNLLVDNDGQAYLLTKRNTSLYIYRYTPSNKKMTSLNGSFSDYYLTDAKACRSPAGVPYMVGFTKTNEKGINGFWVLNLQSEHYKESIIHLLSTEQTGTVKMVPADININTLPNDLTLPAIYMTSETEFALHAEGFSKGGRQSTPNSPGYSTYSAGNIYQIHLNTKAEVSFIMCIKRSTLCYTGDRSISTSFFYKNKMYFVFNEIPENYPNGVYKPTVKLINTNDVVIVFATLEGDECVIFKTQNLGRSRFISAVGSPPFDAQNIFFRANEPRMKDHFFLMHLVVTD